MTTTAGDIGSAPATGGNLDLDVEGVRLRVDLEGESCYIEVQHDATNEQFLWAVKVAETVYDLELIPEDECDVEDTGTSEIHWLGMREETA